MLAPHWEVPHATPCPRRYVCPVARSGDRVPARPSRSENSRDRPPRARARRTGGARTATSPTASAGSSTAWATWPRPPVCCASGCMGSGGRVDPSSARQPAAAMAAAESVKLLKDDFDSILRLNREAEAARLQAAARELQERLDDALAERHRCQQRSSPPAPPRPPSQLSTASGSGRPTRPPWPRHPGPAARGCRRCRPRANRPASP